MFYGAINTYFGTFQHDVNFLPKVFINSPIKHFANNSSPIKMEACIVKIKLQEEL